MPADETAPETEIVGPGCRWRDVAAVDGRLLATQARLIVPARHGCAKAGIASDRILKV